MRFDFERILKLSMLELEEKEKDKIKEDMEKIIEWVSKLEELDIEGEEYFYLKKSSLREDEPKETLEREDVLPENNFQGIFFIVPKVVEK
jgi:aspartyl-tRNA(Asn)/glutamyl-tRNA(Gln) amidotransferase subunit C